MVVDAALPRAVLVVDGMVLGVVGARAVRERDRPGAGAFGTAAVAVAAAAMAVAAVGTAGGNRSLVWATLTGLFLVFVTAWAWFVAQHTGEVAAGARNSLRALAPVPAVGLLTLAAFVLSGRPIPRSFATEDPVAVALVTIPQVVVVAIFFASLLLLALAGLRYETASARRTAALTVGALGVGLVVLVVPLFAVVPGAGSTWAYAMGYTTTAAGFWLATGRWGLLSATPLVEAVGRVALVGNIEDPVVVVDEAGRIADCNDAAARTLGAPLSALAGRPLREYLDVPADLAGVETVDGLEVDLPDGRHVYEASVSPVGYGERVLGYALVCRDVTERRTRRQRLEVLNRVLRHNLRNDVTTVLGYADLLADGGRQVADPRDGRAGVDGAAGVDDTAGVDDERAIERIRETAADLSRLGEKASEIERVVAASRESDGTTDAASLLQYVAEEARATYPDATVQYSPGDPAPIAADEGVCWPVVWNLVENAIEHSDRGEPRVTLRYERTDDPDPRVRVTVADDGPGIPAPERRAIEDGTEGPLSHGSGLGLWAVKWGANRVGGEVALRDRDPRGTEAVVTFPAADAVAGSGGDGAT